MRTITLMLFFLLSNVLAAGGGNELRMAYRHGALVKIVYHVVDTEGKPLENATARIGFYFYNSSENHHVSLKTDVNGIFVAEHKANEKIAVVVEKEGFYDSRDTVMLSYSSDENVVGGKWQPFGHDKTIVLKRIQYPVQMCAMVGRPIKIPVRGQWIGFDFEQKDWVPPYGKGVSSDVLLLFNLDMKLHQSDFCATMRMSFTNHPYAGVYELDKDEYSDMKSVYHADTNATFSSALDFVCDVRTGRRRILKSLPEDRYLVFRTRTKVDKQGRLLSAHYGKIYGQLYFTLSFGANGIYFNPTPNDASIEDKDTSERARNFKRQQDRLRRENAERSASERP